MRHRPVILSIVGSNCLGGAGIQANIKTISALGGYVTSAITAIIVQNTLGVHVIHVIPPKIACGQIEAVVEDLQSVAIRIGMVNDIQIVHVTADCIQGRSPEHVIYDPTIVSTNGRKLMTNEAIEKTKKELLPFVILITPGTDEARVLTGKGVQNIQDMLEAVKQLSDSYQIHILIKDGHLEGDQMCDLLYSSNHTRYIYGERKIENENLYRTGCTFPSVITNYLAKGYSMKKSIRHAKEYITHVIIAGKGLNIGHGNEPLWHFPDSIAQMCTLCAVVS